jgi:hypothetical protein
MPIRLDEGMSLGHVDAEMLDDGSAVVTWVEVVEMRSQLRARRVEKSGATSPAIVVAGAGDSRINGVPRLTRNGRELVFAWNDVGRERRVKTAVASIP